jgi:hypothetical protein
LATQAAAEQKYYTIFLAANAEAAVETGRAATFPRDIIGRLGDIG